MEKGPYLFAEMVHHGNENSREQARLIRQIERNRIERQRRQREHIAKNVIYTVAGTAGVVAVFTIMALCALVMK